ncbi:hypothetical protein AAC387_Pa07g3247 [Persea americana]
MGRGRAPCCDKVGLKKGPWTPAEDMRLVAYISKYGHGNWRALPKQAGLLRCGKSCRLRWINYLRPDIKRGNFSQEEEETIIKLHRLLGNKWSKIASCLPGRTDNEIKNVWNTHLKKRSVSEGSNPRIAESKELSNSSSSDSISSLSHSNQGIGGAGDEEQEHLTFKSESPPAESNTEQLENMQSTLEDIFQLPLDEQSMEIWDMLDESKRTSSPSTSACSSYITCSNQVDAKEAEDQMHSLFKSKSPNDDEHDYDMIHIEAKEEPPKEILEIPCEPDRDFWDMLDDDFCSFSCSGGVFDGPESHINAAINEDRIGEVDYRRVRHLENELELWMMGNDNKSLMKTEIEPLNPSSTDDENENIVPRDSIKYFQTWPQSPFTFSS